MTVATFSWTPEAIKRLRARWRTSATAAEIGVELGTTKNAVLGEAFRLRLPPRPALRAGARNWTDEQVTDLRERHATGTKASLIALALDRSASAVSHKLRQLGLDVQGGLLVEAVAPPADKIMVRFAPQPSAEQRDAQRQTERVLRRLAEARNAGIAYAPMPKIAAVRHARTCQWLGGDRRPYLTCDEPAERGRSYCSTHCVQVYVPIDPRRDPLRSL